MYIHVCMCICVLVYMKNCSNKSLLNMPLSQVFGEHSKALK